MAARKNTQTAHEEYARWVAEIESLRAQLAAREGERDAAIRECSEQARQAGEAQGRLDASEMAGVVQGWKERAEAAEAAIARKDVLLREAVEALGLLASPSMGETRQAHGESLIGWQRGDGPTAQERVRCGAALLTKLRTELGDGVPEGGWR